MTPTENQRAGVECSDGHTIYTLSEKEIKLKKGNPVISRHVRSMWSAFERVVWYWNYYLLLYARHRENVLTQPGDLKLFGRVQRPKPHGRSSTPIPKADPAIQDTSACSSSDRRVGLVTKLT